jgi:long-chain acyl-CoA synthetase
MAARRAEENGQVKINQLIERCALHPGSRLTDVGAKGRRDQLAYPALAAAASALAGRLKDAGLQPGHVVGIQAANGLDWVIWDLALTSLGAVSQAFPDEAPVDQMPTPGLAMLVGDSPGAEVPVSAARDASVELPAPRPGAGFDHEAHSLVFSSGTTGRLKGLRISAEGAEGVIDSFIRDFRVTGDDSHLIFLPLWNFQQRLAVYMCLWTGADVVLTPYQRVFRTVPEVSPTFIIAPPVFYDTVLHLEPDPGRLAAFLGGNIRFLITGMAPIRRDTVDAYWSAGLRLLEAYGMTETGMIAWNTEDAHKPGTVGRLIHPDGARFAPDSELIVTHLPTLSLGYFDSDPAEAASTFLQGGHIATGDVGSLDEEGFLRLHGRKKDLIALANGIKIQPLEIEDELFTVSGVQDVVVIANKHATGLAAVITASQDAQDGIRKAIETSNQAAEATRRITRVLFTTERLRGEPRFMTKNMKLNRGAVAEEFRQHLGRDA